MWGGGLEILSLSSQGSHFKGKIEFAQSNSSCWGYHPFEGSIDEQGLITINTNLGGECGKVIVTLTKSANRWKGRYTAEYPDEGTVDLTSN